MKKAHHSAKSSLSRREKKIVAIACGAVSLSLVAFILISTTFSEFFDYNKARRLIDKGNFEEAYEIISALDDYKDSSALMSNFKVSYTKSFAEQNDGQTIKNTYTYDKNGNLISRTVNYSARDDINKISYEYNDKGDVLKITENDEVISQYEYQYHSNGYILSIKTIEFDIINYHFFEYDDEGYLSKLTTTLNSDGSGIIYYVVYDYDKDNRVVKETTYDGGGSHESWIEYTYNERGNIDTETRMDLTNGSKKTSFIYEFVYDENENVSQMTTLKNGEEYSTTTYSGYEYYYRPNSKKESFMNP